MSSMQPLKHNHCEPYLTKCKHWKATKINYEPFITRKLVLNHHPSCKPLLTMKNHCIPWKTTANHHKPKYTHPWIYPRLDLSEFDLSEFSFDTHRLDSSKENWIYPRFWRFWTNFDHFHTWNSFVKMFRVLLWQMSENFRYNKLNSNSFHLLIWSLDIEKVLFSA